jgi:hypothetical protein
MVSVSVHTDESTILSGDEGTETPRRPGWATPTRSGERQSDEIASSPMNEKELLSMLLTGGAGRRRDLPKPPSSRILVSEDPYVSTALSPRPKSQGRQPNEARDHGHQQRPTGLSRRHSLMSTSSSNYDLEEAFSGIPESDSVANLPRRNTSGGLGPQHSVGSTVAELRRMNSFVSSYSVASVASTYFSAAGGGGADDAATLPALRGGGFSPSRSNSKNALAASRNYLGLNAPRNKGSSAQQQQQQQRQPGNSTPTLVVHKDQSTGTGKENENIGLGLSSMPADRSATVEVGHVRRGQANLMVPSAGDVSRETRGLAAAATAVDPSKRESVETLGLYDSDGFLLNSPERDALGKSGQLRM